MKAIVRTIVTVAAQTPLAPAMATTIASRLQAVTSSTAAQVIAVFPSGVFAMPRSRRMRTSTGKAVMLIAMPMNSANGRNRTPDGASPR